MTMNVLFFEDRGAASYYVDEWLKTRGHNVLPAFNPNDAQSHWETRDKVPIHCIILDLHTPTDGLTEEQRGRSEGGLICAWIWLYDNVLSVAPGMRERTIIYSDYIPALRKSLGEEVDEQLKDITTIPKRQRSSSAKDVTNRIIEIAKFAGQDETN